MKLMAHIGADGHIQGLVVMQDTGAVGMMVPKPEVQVCEIEDPGLGADALESGALEKFIREHKVEVTGARGKLTKGTRAGQSDTLAA